MNITDYQNKRKQILESKNQVQLQQSCVFLIAIKLAGRIQRTMLIVGCIAVMSVVLSGCEPSQEETIRERREKERQELLDRQEKEIQALQARQALEKQTLQGKENKSEE